MTTKRFPVFMSGVIALALSAGIIDVGAANAVAPAPPTATEGVTPFVGELVVPDVSRKVSSITFSIAPKSGTLSETVSGTYSRGYLARHDLIESNGSATVPLYGLYDNYTNTIDVSAKMTNGKTVKSSTTLRTSTWSSDCRTTLRNPTRAVTPSALVPVDFSFMMLKGWVCGAHPVVLDIDRNIRWVGTIGNAQQGSTFVNSTFYVGWGTNVYSIDLAGNSEVVASIGGGYADFHHQIDPGRDGLLLELNKYPDVESDIVEIRGDGTVVNSWDIADIVRSAMIDGGDNPSNFVRQGDDWFHNNAATYWKSRNELVVSGREDFVIGIGYDDHEIKWILGDPDKAWHTYPSLRAFALDLPEGTHPPIGHHAVSITSNDRLMLFDNGYASFHHDPSGSSRGFSAPRQYLINERTGTATEVWQFDHSPSIWSPICSSIYQFGSSYLVDYASEDGGFRLVGLTKDKRVAFDFKFTGSDYSWAWNALPIDLSGIRFR